MFDRLLTYLGRGLSVFVLMGLCAAVAPLASATVVLQSGTTAAASPGPGSSPEERVRPTRNEHVSRGVHWSWVVLAAMIGFAPLAIERIYRKSVSRHRHTRMGVTMLETELEELKTQDRRHRAILETLNTTADGIEINDRDGRQIFSNTKYRELFPEPSALSFDRPESIDDSILPEVEKRTNFDQVVEEQVVLPDGRNVSVKRLRSASGGSVILYADSEEHLPVQPAEVAESDLAREQAGPISDAAPSGERLRVLLAEDNESYQKIIHDVLTAAGHTVETVVDGDAAIAEVQRNAYDVILIDFQMLGMDGVATAQAIRELDGAVAEIPIIALTADATFAEGEQYRSMGASGFVSKPIEPVELFGALGRIRGTEADSVHR